MLGWANGSIPWSSFFNPSLPATLGLYRHSSSAILPANTRSAMERDNFNRVVESSSVTIRQNDYVHGSQNQNAHPAQQQVFTDPKILEESSETGTKHAIEDPSHKSKRVDTRTTPTRAEPMNIDGSRVTLFLENLASQTPESRDSQLHSHLGNSHLHNPDHPYDSLRNQYTYQYNGDGTLFCSGQALPGDFIDGVIQGP
jgi:hypothetical protein